MVAISYLTGNKSTDGRYKFPVGQQAEILVCDYSRVDKYTTLPLFCFFMSQNFSNFDYVYIKKKHKHLQYQICLNSAII